MEQLGAMDESEWTCLMSRMYTTTEESDFMAQLLGGLNSAPFASQAGNLTRNFVDDGGFGDESSSSFLTQETSVLFPEEGLGTDDMISKLCCGDAMRPDQCLNRSFVDGDDDDDENVEAECGANLSLSVASAHGRPVIRTLSDSMEDESAAPVKRLGKKSRNAADVTNKRNVKPRKTRKADSSTDVADGTTRALNNNSQSSSLTCSENGESSSSHKKPQPALNLNGRTRAGRGSATDPQSLYARKRRERINERLKTLQGLVPNGTKVDISTMLEEAVQYVKFLQLQIKLLSSDEMWMYAPLAYNGMEIGLFEAQKIKNMPR